MTATAALGACSEKEEPDLSTVPLEATTTTPAATVPTTPTAPGPTTPEGAGGTKTAPAP